MAAAKLKRSLSTTVLMMYGLGNILGAGIYVLVGKIAGEAGMNAPLAFMIAMVVAALTAFSYMELSSRFPTSAGSALYAHKAFKKSALSLFVGLSMILAGITSAAALSQGFAGYLTEFVAVPELLASVGILVVIIAVALAGISESARLAVLLTIFEVVGLLIIIWFGRSGLADVSLSETVRLDPAIGISGLLSGAFLAFYAFIGFEDMVNVAEEAKNPRRSMPLAIIGALIIATILYMLVVLVSIAAVSPAELAQSSAPLSLVLERTSTVNPAYISFIGLTAALNGVIVQLIMGSRMLYGLASNGLISKRFAAVNSKRHTPVFATLLVGGLMILATIALPLVSLAQATSYLVLAVFFLVNISLIVLKAGKKPHKNIIQVPIILPILGALTSAAIAIYSASGQ